MIFQCKSYRSIDLFNNYYVLYIIYYIFNFYYRYCLRRRESWKPHQYDLGSLRLKISYTSDHVFPPEYYDELRELLLQSPDIEVRYVYLEIRKCGFLCIHPILCIHILLLILSSFCVLVD